LAGRLTSAPCKQRAMLRVRPVSPAPGNVGPAESERSIALHSGPAPPNAPTFCGSWSRGAPRQGRCAPGPQPARPRSTGLRQLDQPLQAARRAAFLCPRSGPRLGGQWARAGPTPPRTAFRPLGPPWPALGQPGTWAGAGAGDPKQPARPQSDKELPPSPIFIGRVAASTPPANRLGRASNWEHFTPGNGPRAQMNTRAAVSRHSHASSRPGEHRVGRRRLPGEAWLLGGPWGADRSWAGPARFARSCWSAQARTRPPRFWKRSGSSRGGRWIGRQHGPL